MAFGSNFWKKTPFLRLLLAMIAGILFQWNLQTGINAWLIFFFTAFIALPAFFFLPFFRRFRLASVNGIVSSILFFSAGGIITSQKDIRNNSQWLGNFYTGQESVIVSANEPPVEKTRSVKVNATVHYLVKEKEAMAVTGKIILYFKKDSALQLDYGSQVIFKKTLQEIKNSGNPGGFDYQRYSIFQGITHQVYLKPGEYEILRDKKESRLKKFIFTFREKILGILRGNIKGDKELGLAEALLIGYKNDLQQSLVQSYTNTGVVHIIAISGLHLGLIYWLLALLLKPLQKKKKIKWMRTVLIISGLWLFSLVAGAQPSILRSALMFTCIVLGESLSKKTSIYNTLAVSAFILLCINPYWLWDVGFQLSYAAVLSIIIFMRPIYNWFYIENKMLDLLWKLNAVTLAAQILTIPLSIYHFHQFPNFFLLTNFLAVPLSSAILLGEIFLCIISFIPAVALLTGKLIMLGIGLMNTYIERIERIPFSLWEGLQISLVQVILLLLFTGAGAYWLMEKSLAGLKLGVAALTTFIALRSWSFISANRQEKIIVYNVPQKKAIDMIGGRDHFFVGDSDLVVNEFVHNFHLKPSRVLHRVKKNMPDHLLAHDNYFCFHGKHILLLDDSFSFSGQEIKPAIDLLVISKNPKIYIKKLAASLDIKQMVFDGSVPAWKLPYWKKDCDSLGIPWHDVSMNGAFVMKLR